MGNYASLPVRRAILTALKRDEGVAALVSERVYGQNVPAEPKFPFVRYGAPTSVPLRATGLDGSRVAMTLHAFAKGSDDGAVDGLAGAIVAALDGAALALDAPFAAKLADVAWEGTTTLEDGDEPNAWHAVIRMAGTVVS